MKNVDKITSKYKVGDEIYFRYSDWDYVNQKTILTKEKGKIIEIFDYTESTFGIQNVNVIPERKDICDIDGSQWIT